VRDDAAQSKQTAEQTAELQRERDRAEAGAAKSAQLLEKGREDATAAAARAAQLSGSLEEERARGAVLASELAQARLAIETNAALLNKVRDDAAQSKQAAEQTAGLLQERNRAESLSRELAMARKSAQHAIDVHSMLEPAANNQTARVTQAVEGAAPEQSVPATSQNGPEVARLLVRARTLLDQGNISAARIVLERAAETGSAQASFMLAETYDPAILSTWGTYGTRGEATKAREHYAKAHAGGIQEAKNRSDALGQ
jgi:hypothetical protein